MQQLVFWMIIAVMAIYIKQIAKGTSVPNPATWLIMSVVGLINAITYGITIQWDLWPTLIGFAPGIGIVITFLFSYLRGKFAPLRTREKVIIGIAGISIVVWKTIGADFGNVIAQVIFLTAFWPTLMQVLDGRKEKSLPWDLAFIAYTLMAIDLAIQKKPDIFSREAAIFAYPLSRIVMNGTIAIACRFRRTA